MRAKTKSTLSSDSDRSGSLCVSSRKNSSAPFLGCDETVDVTEENFAQCVYALLS